MRLHRRLRTAAVLLALLYAAVPAPVWAADAPRTLVYAGGSDITTLDGGFVIDIPAQKPSTLRITCVMGMYNSRIQFN